MFKENSQFLFLCNPQKSGASRDCITFPQITQKILTKDIIHLLELISEILGFLQIFSVRKTTTCFFNISENLQENQNYISDIFWTFKSKLQIIHATTYIHCFFLTLINVFYMFSAIHSYLYLLISHFVFLFSTSFSYSSRHETNSAMCDYFITTRP